MGEQMPSESNDGKPSRRAFLARFAGAAFAVPVISSFALDGVAQASERHEQKNQRPCPPKHGNPNQTSPPPKQGHPNQTSGNPGHGHPKHCQPNMSSPNQTVPDSTIG